jgi:hypothetical protein
MNTRNEFRIALLLACLLAFISAAVYALTARTAGSGAQLMPLDDTYIHFHYARGIAEGAPYIYNPGQPPTSGATSFLYPYLLAAGYSIGFRELDLGVWALLIGALAFAASSFLVYCIGRLHAPWWVAAPIALAFALNGAYAWHAASGMETLLATAFSLLTFYGIARLFHDWDKTTSVRLTVIGGALLALTRPEGAIGAVIGALGIGYWISANRQPPTANTQSSVLSPQSSLSSVPLWSPLLPLLAIGVQPLLNYLITGSPSASGSAAKSLLAALLPQEEIVRRVLENAARMLLEWLLPPGKPSYLTSIMTLLTFFGIGALLLNKARRMLGLLVITWLIGSILLIGTLDTAFWHFYRYQMPFMALLFPLATWGAASIYQRFQGELRVLLAIGLSLIPLLTVSSALDWLNAYRLNVGYVYAQPYQMAGWLAANTPEAARIAVHDVGMMRYYGGRTTLDMVGLTTPGAAAWWRQGPGAVGEWLVAQRPDYIASYGEGHGLGLGYLQLTHLYDELQVTYPVTLDPLWNVALAAPTQGIYRPDWAAAVPWLECDGNALQPYLGGLRLVDSVNVAHLDDEAAHGYQWRNLRPPQGFPSEFNQFAQVDCPAATRPMDGGRRINGEESFTLATTAGEDLLLITRLHPAHAGEFEVYANAVLVGTRVMPPLPGSWLNVATHIPAALVTDGETHIRIVPRLRDGDYMPYQHLAWQGAYEGGDADAPALANFADDTIRLLEANVRQNDRRLFVALAWANDGMAAGDYVWFVHVLDANDQIVVQTDRRPGNGALPPGNWLPGIVREPYVVDMTSVPAGEYRIAVGFYRPQTFERMPVVATDEAGFTVTADGRLMIGNVTIP